MTGGARLAVFVLLVTLGAAQPPGAEQLFRDAVAAQQRGDFSAALRAYEGVLQARPDLVPARANRAAVLVHLGRFDEAIADYLALLRQEPGNAELRLNLALAYYKNGDFAAAAPELQSLSKQRSGDARIAVLLGDCLVHLTRYDEAIALLGPVEAAHPADLDAAFVLGSALVRSGKPREGLPFIERVARSGNGADAWLLAAATQLRMGEFRKALEKDQNDFEANLQLGHILYEQRDLDQAAIFLGRALKIDPRSISARYEMALVKVAQRRDESAASDLESIAREVPAWLQPHVVLATLYYRLNRPSDGLREREIVARLTAEAESPATGVSGKPPLP